MRCIHLACAAGLALAAGIQAAAAADADVARQFGLLGRMALDCAAPMSGSNPNLIFAIGGNGRLTRTLRMADKDLDATFALRNLRMVGPNIIQYEETGRQSELTISLAKIDGKFRSWRSVRVSGAEKGKVLIADGKLAGSGNNTVAFAHCGN
jgi:hypothetical protein